MPSVMRRLDERVLPSRTTFKPRTELASLFADQIESVLTLGGREALRESLSELDDGQRQVLGETLAELAHA